MKSKKFRGFFLSLAVATLSMAFAGPSAAANSHTINSGARVQIDEHNVCRKVKNTSSMPMNIPTKSASEWSVGANAFLGASRDFTVVGPCYDAVMEPLLSPATFSGWGADSTYNRYTLYVNYDLDDFPSTFNFNRNNIWRIDFDGSNPLKVSDYISSWQEWSTNKFRGNFYTALKADVGESIARKRRSYFVFNYSKGNGTNFNYRVLHAEPEGNDTYKISTANYSIPNSVKNKGPYDKIILPYSLNSATKITLNASQVRALTDSRNKLWITNQQMKVVLDGATKDASNSDGDFYRFPTGELVVTYNGNLLFSVK